MFTIVSGKLFQTPPDVTARLTTRTEDTSVAQIKKIIQAHEEAAL